MEQFETKADELNGLADGAESVREIIRQQKANAIDFAFIWPNVDLKKLQNRFRLKLKKFSFEIYSFLSYFLSLDELASKIQQLWRSVPILLENVTRSAAEPEIIAKIQFLWHQIRNLLHQCQRQ